MTAFGEMLRWTALLVLSCVVPFGIFVGRNNIVQAEHCSLPRWQERLFIRLSRMSAGAASFFRIPPNKVVELGARITI